MAACRDLTESDQVLRLTRLADRIRSCTAFRDRVVTQANTAMVREYHGAGGCACSLGGFGPCSKEHAVYGKGTRTVRETACLLARLFSDADARQLFLYGVA